MKIDFKNSSKRKLSSDSYAYDSELAPIAPTAGARRGLDKRQVSMRWLSGTMMTGVFSLALFSGALYASLNGLYNFASPPELINRGNTVAEGEDLPEKEDRLSFSTLSAAPERVILEETGARVENGKQRLVSKPFVYLRVPLVSAVPIAGADLPSFNPIKLFAEASESFAQQDTKVETTTEMKLDNAVLNIFRASIPKSMQIDNYIIQSDLQQLDVFSSLSDLSEDASDDAVFLEPNNEQAVLSYTLPNLAGEGPTFDAGSIGRKSAFLATSPEQRHKDSLQTQVFEIFTSKDIATALQRLNVPEQEITQILSRVSELNDNQALITAKLSSYASTQVEGVRHVARLSLSSGETELSKIARLANNSFVSLTLAQPRVNTSLIKSGMRRANLFESLHETGRVNNLPKELIEQIIRLNAFNLDFSKPVESQDYLELFYEPEENAYDTPAELLYVSLTFQGQANSLYRFQNPEDGTTDYFNANGSTARKFLIRKPVQNGTFRSGFGMRRHPILKTSRMHKGVDWSAPYGTPIVAAGAGIIQEAQWKSGYGRWVEIRHANGYATAYAHMSNFGPGIAPGVRVRLGQVIGYIGTSGLSSGPHLHYEMTVNGRNVDPLRIRLANDKALSGRAISYFNKEKARINTMLKQAGRDVPVTTTSN